MGLFDNTLHPDCPTRRFCRYSDMVFTNYAGNLGIRIVQATSGLFTGTVVDKIGKRSGWTSGAITHTCTDVNVVEVDTSGTVNDTDNTMLCHSLVSTLSLPGDRGAPVFQFYPG